MYLSRSEESIREGKGVAEKLKINYSAIFLKFYLLSVTYVCNAYSYNYKTLPTKLEVQKLRPLSSLTFFCHFKKIGS
jgi:hypothetical protein